MVDSALFLHYFMTIIIICCVFAVNISKMNTDIVLTLTVNFILHRNPGPGCALRSIRCRKLEYNSGDSRSKTRTRNL